MYDDHPLNEHHSKHPDEAAKRCRKKQPGFIFQLVKFRGFFLFRKNSLYRFLFPTFLMCPLSLRHPPYPPLLGRPLTLKAVNCIGPSQAVLKHRGFGGKASVLILPGDGTIFWGVPWFTTLPETKKNLEIFGVEKEMLNLETLIFVGANC